ncbi:MAG: beta strand repeat-containing protein [Gemmataceae bacterium]
MNAKSTAGDVIFADTVTTTQVGGFTSEATLVTKATKIANAVTVGAGANALVTGNLISNSLNSSSIATLGLGNITITGNVDASVAGNDLTLNAGSGVVTLSGNVGSGTTAFGNLVASGTGTFLASGTVKADGVYIGRVTPFATSITFAKAVTAVGAANIDGVVALAVGAAPITFSDTITVSGNASTSLADVYISSVSGAINVVGAITGLDSVQVYSTSGAITLSGAITTSGTVTSGAGSNFGNIKIGTNTAGNVLLSGNISTTGTGDIFLDNDGTGTLTINGNVSTSGGGNIFLGADNFGASSGTSDVLTINGTVTTTGTGAGDIILGVSNGTALVNKAITAGATGDVVFINNVATDVFTIASGANISAGDDVFDFGVTAPGIINLGANVTALNDTSGSGGGISFFNSINLTGAVSMKAAGTTGGIVLDSVNGAQNLTLEATSTIGLGSVGQTTALKTVTVTNSTGVSAGAFTAANVVLSDTTGNIIFNGATVITSGLTTAVKPYSVEFYNTTVLSGAPVFLNTGNVSFSGITSLPSGATIIGGPSTEANLAGTIVSGGAFNIGSGISVIDISNNTQLILNSATAVSTFASPISLSTIASAAAFKLLGVGTLTLSADSTAGVTTNDSISVINGTLDVTGKLGNASLTSLTSGTITGAGGTIGALTVNTGTVAPGGTLNTGVVTFNAATNYNAAILTNTTASNLKTSSAINLNGANLALSSIPNGLIVGNVFTIIDNTATQTGINGTFAGLPEGSSVSAKDASGNTIAFTISYKGGTNTNDVTLTVASITPSQTATPQPMVAGEPVLNKFTAFGADAGGGPLVTITFANGTYTSFFAYDPAFRGGVRVALGDVNADGTPEVITGAGAGGGPQVNVYSVNPFSGAVSLQSSFYAFSDANFSGGVYVAVGRTNSDAFDDIIVGAGAGGGPRVQVYAGSPSGVVTSSTLIDFFAYATEFTGGVVVAAGDRTGDGVDQVITAPASNGGWNIKSFYVTGTINNPLVIDNFFAFNNTTSVGGLSLAVGYLNSGSVADLIIGTTNGGYGVIIDSATSGIAGAPFRGYTGIIRAGVAEDSTGKDYAVALFGPFPEPGSSTRVEVFSVGATSLTETDNLYVMNPVFTGGLFGTPTLPRNFR